MKLHQAITSLSQQRQSHLRHTISLWQHADTSLRQHLCSGQGSHFRGYVNVRDTRLSRHQVFGLNIQNWNRTFQTVHLITECRTSRVLGIDRWANRNQSIQGIGSGINTDTWTCTTCPIVLALLKLGMPTRMSAFLTPSILSCISFLRRMAFSGILKLFLLKIKDTQFKIAVISRMSYILFLYQKLSDFVNHCSYLSIGCFITL